MSYATYKPKPKSRNQPSTAQRTSPPSDVELTTYTPTGELPVGYSHSMRITDDSEASATSVLAVLVLDCLKIVRFVYAQYNVGGPATFATPLDPSFGALSLAVSKPPRPPSTTTNHTLQESRLSPHSSTKWTPKTSIDLDSIWVLVALFVKWRDELMDATFIRVQKDELAIQQQRGGDLKTRSWISECVGCLDSHIAQIFDIWASLPSRGDPWLQQWFDELFLPMSLNKMVLCGKILASSQTDKQSKVINSALDQLTTNICASLRIPSVPFPSYSPDPTITLSTKAEWALWMDILAGLSWLRNPSAGRPHLRVHDQRGIDRFTKFRGEPSGETKLQKTVTEETNKNRRYAQTLIHWRGIICGIFPGVSTITYTDALKILESKVGLGLMSGPMWRDGRFEMILKGEEGFIPIWTGLFDGADFDTGENALVRLDYEVGSILGYTVGKGKGKAVC